MRQAPSAYIRSRLATEKMEPSRAELLWILFAEEPVCTLLAVSHESDEGDESEGGCGWKARRLPFERTGIAGRAVERSSRDHCGCSLSSTTFWGERRGEEGR